MESALRIALVRGVDGMHLKDMGEPVTRDRMYFILVRLDVGSPLC